MTTAEFRLPSVLADPDVYAPQHDSWLLCDAAASAGIVPGSRVLDMCTGSGAVAIAAATLGARAVTAFDISPNAVDCATRNAVAADVEVTVLLGSFAEALAAGPFDAILCNPPYVPSMSIPTGTGLDRAWDAGADGRIVLDALCANADRLLSPSGVLMIVQSEFADADKTCALLDRAGFDVTVVAGATIAFGPVMHDRAGWLEETGRLDVGRRTEELVVIRADRR